MKKSVKSNFRVLYFSFKNPKTKRMFMIFISLILIFIAINMLNSNLKQRPAKQVFSYNNSATTVIVDAGHGGEDGGSISPNNILEKDVNLAIALKLKDFLILNGFNVIMIREEDVSIYDKNNKTLHQKKVSDINNRIKIANDNKDAIYISIHQNTFPQESVRDTQVFYSKGNEQSKTLAKIIQDKFIKEFNQKGNRAIKQAYNDILLMKKIENVAVLIECGFLSNPQEEKMLTDEAYQAKIAFTIMSSLYEFLIKQAA